jgi:hypothetical protein
MRRLTTALLVSTTLGCAPGGGPDSIPDAAADAPSIAFTNAQWLGSSGFERGTRYVVAGRISTSRPARVDTTVDLTGGFVVPPFGEAHNHNIDFSTDSGTAALVARYLQDGVFYAKNPGNVPRARAQLRGRINVPTGVDAIFAHGLLTATDGHPLGLYRRNLARGGMGPEDGDGGFFWIIDSLPDLERKWPRIVEGRPDFIKVILVHSEQYATRRADTSWFNWKGLDPALVPEIVRRAHRANLRVSAHIETAADFRAAVAAGVDEINHMPGFRGDERTQLPEPRIFELSADDARRAAARKIVVVTTLGGVSALRSDGPDSLMRRRADSLHTRNLRLLRAAGVHLAIGSDAYRDDSSGEIRYLATLGVFSDLELLRLWSESTPGAIFPSRRVGCLEDGCEASFLVLGADPSNDISRVGDIRLRLKDGMILTSTRGAR